MKTSLTKGIPHGYEVGDGSFTINGRMLGHGEPVRVKQGERVLFHVLNGSATEIRGLALPGHSFLVIALDGNPVPSPARVPVLWLGTAERISAIVEMNHPGVWVMGDLADDDRQHGMGIVVEYSGHKGKGQWSPPVPYQGFNRWTINGVAYPMTGQMAPASFHLKEGKRYRIRMRNASDDIHPVHLHRHSFELTSIAEKSTSGVLKDVSCWAVIRKQQWTSLLTILGRRSSIVTSYPWISGL